MPSIGRPTTKPSTQPGFASRPSTGDRPSIGGNRPTTLPGNIGGNRPGTGDRPSIGGGDRPGFGGGDRPSLGGGNRPGSGNRPGFGNIVTNRPDSGGGNRPDIDGNRPGFGDGDRPSRGDLNDFLGIHRPNTGGNRPSLGDRPGFGHGNRPDRPINIGNNVNLNINNRPSWVNIDNDRVNKINNNWQNAINRRGDNHGYRNWRDRYPDRYARNRYYGSNVRNHWRNNYYRYDNCFSHDWWHRHNHSLCGWSYAYGFNNYGLNYWWNYPTSWSTCASWFTWSAPSTVWAQPIYYDYGTGGNVVIQDNSVYINEQEVASVEDYAQSAAALATVPPPESKEEAEEMEWMPLGTFAIVTDKDEEEPSTVIQLAVSKDGIVSGTLYNRAKDDARSIQGQVDKDTQRVAFRVSDSENVVMETGLYNLTQEEAPVMAHYGTETIKYYLFVRLENPEGDQG